MGTELVWFRRDLRLGDHGALNSAVDAAGSDGNVVGLFVLDPALLGRRSGARPMFMAASVEEMRGRSGGGVWVREGRPQDVVAEVAAHLGATRVFVSGDYAPAGTARDTRVARALRDAGRALVSADSPYVVEPGTISPESGLGYRVFTAFMRAWTRVGAPDPYPERVVPWAGADPRPVSLKGLGDAVPAWLLPGELAGVARLDRFVTDDLAGYAARRDRPGDDATSRLSPYLRFGCLHPRTVLARLGEGGSADVMRSELAWREFYADVLFRRPDSAWTSMQPKMRAMRVDTDRTARERFAAWTAGRTGYPIVDAGMRQLLAEGFVHNRVRMVVASFLVKDLHLPWQWGARWFMEHLVDGDLASNNHGWQWSAGTGTDAAPYFRIFNPVTQGTTHDPLGTYVRRWVPELADVPASHLHRPWLWPGGPPAGYPRPIVDHAGERAESLRRLGALDG